MKLSRVVLLTGVLLLAFGATPSKGNGQALKQWMDSAKEVGFIDEPSAITAVWVYPIHAYVDEIRQVKEIFAAKSARYNDLVVFSGQSTTPIDQSRLSKTNYLPWQPNKATFLRLDHNMWGTWYLTSPLSGCDVWIADHRNFDPLTIHINANSLAQFPLRNLQYKEELANVALNYFNERVMINPAHYYKFIQRISYDYASDPGISPQERQEISNYWKNFRFPYVFYSTDKGEQAFLYGTYSSGWFSSAWSFVLKELISGRILLKLNCNESSSSCTIQ